MSIEVYWEDEEQTIVRYDFKGHWTWDEFYPVLEKALEMERAKPYRVDVILDMRKNEVVPANVLTHLKSIADHQPDNIGISVFVSENRFLLSLFSVGTRFYSRIGHYFRVVSSIEEAHQMIRDAR